MHNGKKRQWDFVKTHDSVFIIIYHITKKVLVLVKQFRPPVYFGNIPESDRQGEIDVNKYPAELGKKIPLKTKFYNRKHFFLKTLFFALKIIFTC